MAVTILDDVLENDKAELVQSNKLAIQQQIAQLQDYDDEEDISNTDEDDCSHNIQSAEASLLKLREGIEGQARDKPQSYLN